MNKLIIFVALFGSALGGNLQHAGSYAQPAAAYGQPAIAYAQPAAAIAPALKSSGPQGYAHQIPAAAIRNVETVGVTKTITPVVTKTTTHQTHSEPALSVGHVQGYTQSAHGAGQVAPVQYNTQYTQYLNPTVGVNGPVTYSGPAVGHGGYAVQPAYSGGAIAAPAYAGGAIAAPAYASAGLAYAAPAIATQAYAAPAYAAPAYAAPAIGYSGISGYAAQPALQSAALALPAELNGGSYGGAQFLSGGLSTGYGLHK